MIPVNGPSFGRLGGALRRYPWRHRERQHLTDSLAVYTKHPRGLAGAHPLDMTRPPNPCVQLHPIHPPRLPVRATLTEGYTRSHFGPPQPDRPGRFSGGLLLCRSQRASRTRRYRSTVYILPPSHLKKDRRLQVAEFYSARSWEIPPLPWTILSPPFSRLNVPPPSWPGIAQYRAEPHVSKEIRRIALNIQFAPGHAM